MTEFHYLQLISLTLLVFLAWLMPKRFQMDTIALATMALLGWFSITSLALLCISSLLIFWGAKTYHRKQGLIVVGLIVYCGIQFLTLRTLQTHMPGWEALSVLGLAYYTCRHIHFVMDSFNGRIQSDLRTFWHYQFFWPVMITGPIHRYNNFYRQCQRRRWDTIDISLALHRVVMGYAQVVILGNYIVAKKCMAWLTTLPDMGLLNTLLSSVCDWVYLYLQFAGWSSVAIGFSLLMGIRIEENFNKPFLATNIIDFWQRWHMTLSNWCRDYVFTPLFAVTRKPFVSILAAMVVMGVWHEISIYYLLWGVYQAAGIAGCHLFQTWQKSRGIKVFDFPLSSLMSWFITMLFLVSGDIMIKAAESYLQELI
jgi:alginate O-acetyltransferase complex protein AlgI